VFIGITHAFMSPDASLKAVIIPTSICDYGQKIKALIKKENETVLAHFQSGILSEI
jgi:hypothetical protein